MMVNRHSLKIKVIGEKEIHVNTCTSDKFPFGML